MDGVRLVLIVGGPPLSRLSATARRDHGLQGRKRHPRIDRRDAGLAAAVGRAPDHCLLRGDAGVAFCVAVPGEVADAPAVLLATARDFLDDANDWQALTLEWRRGVVEEGQVVLTVLCHVVLCLDRWCYLASTESCVRVRWAGLAPEEAGAAAPPGPGASEYSLAKKPLRG